MGRPIYPYELGDPDFSWLISNFQENFPYYSSVEDTCLPVVFIENDEQKEMDVHLEQGDQRDAVASDYPTEE